MRLNELFTPVLNEAPTDNQTDKSQVRTITFSAADAYLMTLQEIPKTKNKRTGKDTVDPEAYKENTYEIGTGPGQIDPKFAATLQQWKADGSVPGMMRNEKGELDTYDKNSYAHDIGLTLMAATVELGANLTRAGAIGGDYVVNGVIRTTDLVLNKYANIDAIDKVDYTKMRLTDMATGTIDDPMWLDKTSKDIESWRSKQFNDNMDLTAGAVGSWEEVALFMTGGSTATIGGAFALMAGELPSEIVDVALLAGTSWWTGGALNVAFNAGEASGAAAKEMQRQINAAYKSGLLQQTANWQTNLKAAADQIKEDGTVYETDKEYATALEKLAMDQTVYSAYHNGLWKIAASAGVLDTVADRLMIRSPIKTKHILGRGAELVVNGLKKTGRVGKGAVVEMGQEAFEQYLQNLAVIHATGDQKVTQTLAGVLNAGYNSIYGTAASGVAQTGLSAGKAIMPKKVRASMAALRKFYAGEGSLRELFYGTSNNPELLAAAAMNQETGQLDLLGMLKKRDSDFKTVDDLSEKDRKAIEDGTFRGRYFTIDGKRYDRKLIEKNSEDAEVMKMFQNSVNLVAENKIQSTFDTEEQAVRASKVLGIHKKGDDINQTLAKLEDFTKLDVRIAGSSTLEAPLWSELDELQKRQFVTDGQITFDNHPERGNQTWSRDKVLYTSRINGETIPSEIQNLVDNVEARPTATNNDRQLGMENDMVRSAEAAAFQDFTDEQQMWDEEFGATHNPDGSPKDPNATGDAGRQLTGDDTTEELQGRRPEKNMEHYQQIAQSKLLSDVSYQNAKKRLEDQKEQFAKELKDDQDAWDQKNSTTHHNTGVAKLDSRFIDGPPVGSGATSVPSDGSAAPADSDQADADNIDLDTTAPSDDTTDDTTDDEFDPTITPADLTGDEDPGDKVIVQPPTLSNNKQVAMDQVVYRMKMNIAEGGYDKPGMLQKTLEILEQDFPGITQRVVPNGIDDFNANQEPVKKDTAAEIEETDKPTYTPSKRPPQGTVVELDGKPYVWLGAEAGVGGMWAEQKDDGTRGTTNHPNHKELNRNWEDSQITPTESPPGFGEVEVPDAPDQLKSPELDNAPEIQSDPPGPEVSTVPPVQPSGDTTSSDSNAPETPTIDTPPVSQTAPEFDADPSPDELNIDTTSLTAPTTGSGRGDGQAELAARRQKAKDDKAKADADADADSIDLDTTAPEPDKSDADNIDLDTTAPEIDKDDADNMELDAVPPKGPEVSTVPPEQPKLGDTPKLDTITAPKQDGPIRFVQPNKIDPGIADEVPAIDTSSPVPIANNRPDALDLPGTSAPDPVTGSGRGDGQAELDARRQKAKDDKAKADADADADNIDLDTTAPEPDKSDADNMELDAVPPGLTKGPDVQTKVAPPTGDISSTDSGVKTSQPDANTRPDALDLPSTSKDDTKIDTGPVDQNPDVDGFQSTPSTDTDTNTDTVVNPDTVPIVPPVVTKPNAKVTVDPNAKTTTTTDKKGTRKVRPGMPGKSKDTAKWDWKGPEFNPANFRDPLNLMKYKGVSDTNYGMKTNRKQF